MALNECSSNRRHTVSTESGYERDLEPGEPNEPTSCTIATADGRRVECTIERKDLSTWIARPLEPHSFQEGDRFLIDRLPAGGAVEFQDVMGPDHEDWSGRTATRPAT